MNRRRLLNSVISLSTLALMFVLTACVSPFHKHEFLDPTCDLPAMCVICNAEEGEPLGHNFTDATCTEAARCLTCGAHKGQPLGHDFSKPTCVLPGACTRCDLEIAPQLGHTYEPLHCDETWYCDVCKEPVHTPVEHKFSAPTCTTLATCLECGVTDGELLPHEMAEPTCVLPPTCIACGFTEGEPLGHTCKEKNCEKDKICSVCGELIEAAKEHAYSEATCTTASKCKVCGVKKGNALGHYYSPATCQVPATCQRCKAVSGNPLPHNFILTDSTTTETTVVNTYSCAMCGEVKTETKNVPSSSSVYNAMMSLYSSYPEGMTWTNDNFYAWNGGIYSGGYGCAGFAFILSDAAFGNLPARFVYDRYAVRVGDVLRINGNTHSVIVLSIDGDTLTIAEGNYGGTIHWGRTLSLSGMSFDYLLTRYD